MASTVREALKARIERLQAKKQQLQAEIAVLQIEIDALRAERDTLTQPDEDRFARLQALAVIKAED